LIKDKIEWQAIIAQVLLQVGLLFLSTFI